MPTSFTCDRSVTRARSVRRGAVSRSSDLLFGTAFKFEWMRAQKLAGNRTGKAVAQTEDTCQQDEEHHDVADAIAHGVVVARGQGLLEGPNAQPVRDHLVDVAAQ